MNMSNIIRVMQFTACVITYVCFEHLEATVIFMEQGHTQIPTVPVATTELDLTYHLIQSTTPEDFQGLTSLENLKMDDGILNQFPNLKFVTATLRLLSLSNNTISYIPDEHLNILVKLEYLGMFKNKLSALADVSGPSNTLTKISLNDNNFVEFPYLKNIGKSLKEIHLVSNKLTSFKGDAVNIAGDTDLKIYIGDNKLESLEPVIASSVGTSVNIFAYVNPLVCDKRLSWLIGSNIKLYGSCTSGLFVQNLDASQLGITQDMNSGSETQREFNSGQYVKDMFSVTTALEHSPVDSVQECALRCLQTPGCVYVNYRPSSSDDINCYFASPLSGTNYNGQPAGTGGWTYYGFF